MAKVKYDELEFHPLADQFDLLGDYELRMLAESIEIDGLRYPITIHKESGKIIDGRNRYRALREAKIPPQKHHFEILDIPEDRLLDWIDSRNVHRRHMPEGQLKPRREARHRRVMEMRRSGMSLRAIAEKEGVSDAQIRRDLAASGAPPGAPEMNGAQQTARVEDQKPSKNGKNKPPAKEEESDDCDTSGKPESVTPQDPPVVTGRDGKTYSATAKKPGPVDGVGRPVEPALEKVFEGLTQFDAIKKALRQAQQLIHDLAETPGGAVYRSQLGHRGDETSLRHYCSHVTNALSRLDWARPHTVCPYCHHAGKVTRDCRACHGLGWVTKQTYQSAPEEYRQGVEAGAGSGVNGRAES